MNSQNVDDEFTERYGKWDFYRNELKDSSWISDSDKATILRGFDAIQEIMGDPWFKEAARDRYLLIQRLGNLSADSLLAVARVGLQLQALRTVPNFGQLKKRMQTQSGYAAVEAELEVAWCLVKAGFSVKFYPPVGNKEADVLASRDGIDYYIEVTAIGDSMETGRIYETMNRLQYPVLMTAETYFAGRIYKPLSVAHIEDLKRQISIAIDMSKTEHRCIELSEGGVIDLLVCPMDLAQEAKAWRESKGIVGSFMGPPLNVDEAARIRQRLNEKALQLPEDHPGVIVVFARSLTMQIFEPAFYDALADELAETVYSHGRLIMGAIIASAPQNLEHTIKEGSGYYLGHRTINGKPSEDVLVIPNRYSKYAFNDQVAQALFLT